jgi:hypothetical protein
MRSRRLSWAIVLVLCLGGAAVLAAPPPGSPVAGARELRVAVALDEPAEQLRLLRGRGYDVNTFDIKTGTAYLVVWEGQLASLRTLGFEPVLVEDVTTTAESTEALGDYHDEVESAAAVDRIASDYPDIARKLEYADPTEQGRVVTLLEISDNVGADEPEPRILFVSQHHAREVMTPEVLIDLADHLTQNYGIDPEVTRWVDDYQIYIIPTHNPDGTHHVFNVYNNWRKNRRDNGDGTFGVDLNRNYPYLWGPDGCGGSSGSTSSDTYRGPTPGSEPETSSLMEIVREVKPSISLTYHTYGEYVLHPFGCDPNLPDDPDRRAHRDIGSGYAAVVVNDAGNGYYRMGTPYELLYEVDGDSDGWLHAIGGTVGLTIEMSASSQGFQPDYDTWRDDTVARNLEGLYYLLRRLSGGAITSEVRDACTGDGIVAEVGLAGQTFTQGQEPRTSLAGHGFAHRVVIPGEYTWYAAADGYHRQEWSVVVNDDPVRRDLWLVPSGSHGAELRGFRVADAAGDEDGQLDPGETVDLWPTALASGEDLTGLVATLSTDDPYLRVLDAEATFGAVPAGTDAEALDPFEVEVLADAPDGHEAAVTVSFLADQSLCRDVSGSTLWLTRGAPSCPFEVENFDDDPGWTITGPAGGWEFGDPAGSGGHYGPPDPVTGSYVYGTNLDGNYGSSAGEFALTSTPFDLQGLRDARLRFHRWLNNEPGYDPVRVEVSVDEETWIELWRGFGRDTRWEEYTLDLPPEVDNADRVWVRFVLEQDGGGSRSGLYIDDVSFCGESSLTAGGRLRYDSHVIEETDPLYGNADGAVDAGETVRMVVSVRSTRTETAEQVSAVLTTMDPDVTIHNDVALYPDIAAGDLEASLPPHFTFTAGPECAAKIAFTLETRAADGSSSLSHFSVPVGTLAPATLFSDDMEQDRGWTVSGGATDGEWVREDPSPNFYDEEMTNPDQDHTADPAVFCWVTGNVPPPGVVPPKNAEVDGTTILTSPLLAAGAYETLELDYWRWFYTGGGPGPDIYRVEVSNDGGDTFRTVDETGVKANEWINARHELSELVTPSDQLLVRFVVDDGGGESICEGGLDDVVMSGEQWVCDAWSPPALDPPNPVGNTLMVSRRGFDVRLDWEEPPVDPAHDEATFYRVTRSEQPDAGFGLIAEPTDPLHFDVGAAGPSARPLFFYLVTAENEGADLP